MKRKLSGITRKEPKKWLRKRKAVKVAVKKVIPEKPIESSPVKELELFNSALPRCACGNSVAPGQNQVCKEHIRVS